MTGKKKVEVVFTPELYKHYDDKEAIVVVVDIFRATTAICTAIENGVDHIVPVPSLEEARKFKEKGYIVAAERDGKVLDFADFGNSPFNFTRDRIEGEKVAYSTTNGTKAVKLAKNSQLALIASFVNISAVADLLLQKKQRVLILCAGWKGTFCLEDAVFAGALGEKLLADDVFWSDCDSLTASLDLWSQAKKDVLQYIEKAMQRHRLKRLGIDDILEYAHTPDSSSRIPVYMKGIITDFHKTTNL